MHYGVHDASGDRNIYFRLSGIKDGVSTSEKREFLISVGGRDTVRRIYSILPDSVRRIYSILPDLFGIDAHLFEFT